VRNNSFNEALQVPFFQFGLRSINKNSLEVSVVWLDYKDVFCFICALDHEKQVNIVEESSSLLNLLSLEENIPTTTILPQSPSTIENDSTSQQQQDSSSSEDELTTSRRLRKNKGQRIRNLKQRLNGSDRIYGGAPFLIVRNIKNRRVTFMCVKCEDHFPTKYKLKRHAVDFHGERNCSKRVLCRNGNHIIRPQHFNSHKCGKHKSVNMSDILRKKGFLHQKF